MIDVKKLIVFFIVAILFNISQAATYTVDPYPFTDKNDAVRFTELTKEIRCVVCKNQNIADSSASLAMDLRQKVYRMVLAKQSDQAIKNYLVKRYGDFILMKPRFNIRTAILWLFPFIGLGFMILVVVQLFNRKDKPLHSIKL